MTFVLVDVVAAAFTNSDFWDFERAMMYAENRRTHGAFLNRIFRPPLEPNPLPLLARAVNGLLLRCRVIFQPRWKATRFKAKT